MEIREITDSSVTIGWQPVSGARSYKVYWSDRDTPAMEYKCMAEVTGCTWTLKKATHIPHYLKLSVVKDDGEHELGEKLKTPVKKVFSPQLEKLGRGLIAVPVKNGIFLSWRMFLDEVKGYNSTGLTGTDYKVYRNGKEIALVTDSTNYLDRDGKKEDRYQVAPVPADGGNGGGEAPLSAGGKEGGLLSGEVTPWEQEYLDIPLKKPEGGVTPAGESYEYSANDMSVADVDGDGEYEYLLKWDPSNSHDVSIPGYTGKCYIDCYKLDGRLLWRLDMGVNIRAGAHYTQFMAYDFNGDGKAELAVKTAPGTKMIRYSKEGFPEKEQYITMPQEDMEAGYSHEDNYVCTAADYREHLIEVFQEWQEHPEVKAGHWPGTLEACFGIEARYSYPLVREDAEKLADYLIYEYAPGRHPSNHLEQFEGFIFKGPEYLTMFAGDGAELETIRFVPAREDDGLLWGDYALPKIEPCNRVDRFLSGVAYLDGERPYLIVCRGYYTRTVISAYDFFENKFRKRFTADSGFIPMENPFDCPGIHEADGSDPVYGVIAGQGNHSLSTADVDGDGFMEIIYGGCVIDHDGSVLYSSRDLMPDGSVRKLGHGDSMHVARIDLDRPGFQIFNVFEGGSAVPYGYALRDAETGEVFFGKPADGDLDRCMIGKIDKRTRGYQVWLQETFDCKGRKLDVPLLGTNQSIRFAADLTTQITDTPDYLHGLHRGVICDNIHGIMLNPKDTLANNGTKGNPCLIADIFGDFREEILLRTTDSSAIRIYTNTEITKHKLFTLMHDTQYRCGVAWQNNCYNQPAYPSFYYGSDMDFGDVLPQMEEEKDMTAWRRNGRNDDKSGR